MLDRSSAPPFLKSNSFSLPPYQSLKTSHGVPVHIVSDVQQDVIKVEMVFNAGKWQEPGVGVSHFAANMLEKGTASQSATELAEAFDLLGAHIEILAGYDTATVAIYSLKKNWKQSMTLLADMVVNPSFDQEELDLMKSIFYQNLKVNLEKTSFVAGQLIRKNIYGAHPYGTSVDERDVQAITREQLLSFHKTHFSPLAIFVTAPPSIGINELMPILDAFKVTTVNNRDAVEIKPGKKTEHVSKEGVQTTLRLGKRSLQRTDKHYPDILLFTHILGGYFGSRLMKNIREEKGLTYGIYSSINPFQRDGFFVIGADVNKENRDIVLNEIAAEIKRMRTEPVDAEELEISRNHFLGSLQSEVANPFSVTDKVRNIHLNNLPADYYPHLFKRISDLTPADLLSVGETYLHEDSLQIVTVG